MLIYSNEPLNVMMKNILLLDDPFAGGYVYVSKETFEQALSLKITFNEDINRVKGTISGKGMLNWAANKVVNHVVSLCSEQFCSPINMLAPYLAYTLPIGVEWPEDDKEILKMAYGVLHQMSQFINFYATALMPAGAKADITIPKNIIMAYEDSWKAQLDTLGQCVVTLPVYVSTGAPVQQVVQEQAPVKEVATPAPVPVAVPAPVLEEEDNDDVAVPVRAVVPEPEDIEEEPKVEENNGNAEAEEDNSGEDEKAGEAAEEKKEEESSDEDGEEEDPAAMEARLLALMKSIEEAPAEQFQPKEEEKPVTPAEEPKKEEKKKDEVKYGESGSINMTEREIADGNRRLLNDYDI